MIAEKRRRIEEAPLDRTAQAHHQHDDAINPFDFILVDWSRFWSSADKEARDRFGPYAVRRG
jgi:hypothetical protein